MNWLKDNWLKLVLLLGLAGVVVLYILTRNKEILKEARRVYKKEVKIIDARADVRKTEATQGRDAAVAKVHTDYEEQIAAFEKEDQEKIKELESNPQALVEFVIRIID